MSKSEWRQLRNPTPPSDDGPLPPQDSNPSSQNLPSLMRFPFGLHICRPAFLSLLSCLILAPLVAILSTLQPPFPWLPGLSPQREMKRLGVATSPQGWNKIHFVLDSKWPSRRGHCVPECRSTGSLEVVQRGHCKEDSQIFLCMESQRASQAQSHLL